MEALSLSALDLSMEGQGGGALGEGLCDSAGLEVRQADLVQGPRLPHIGLDPAGRLSVFPATLQGGGRRPLRRCSERTPFSHGPAGGTTRPVTWHWEDQDDVGAAVTTFRPLRRRASQPLMAITEPRSPSAASMSSARSLPWHRLPYHAAR